MIIVGTSEAVETGQYLEGGHVVEVELSSEGCKNTKLGEDYEGSKSVSKSGKTCQRWDTQTPHSHTRNNVNDFPESQLEDAANYCRNPDNEPDGPWCYTTDPNKRWEYCDVPLCGRSSAYSLIVIYILLFINESCVCIILCGAESAVLTFFPYLFSSAF